MCQKTNKKMPLFEDLNVSGGLQNLSDKTVGSCEFKIKMEAGKKICRQCIKNEIDGMATHLKKHKGVIDE